ncbi:hypothetical protein [Burkholderia pseudomallei]|uniref:hypothetical protein n=1 Tax=Burkholderia pseudomallei TaxID=28450 RepID=UPI00048E41F6|nr:hypothetical protein [Burkholderia pseudomallei]
MYQTLSWQKAFAYHQKLSDKLMDLSFIGEQALASTEPTASMAHRFSTFNVVVARFQYPLDHILSDALVLG